MYALITGASSGIGYEFAKELNKMGYNLILVARNENKLLELKNELKGNIIIKPYDVSILDNIYKLFDEIKDLDLELIINNAGFGDCGYILDTDINKELQMIDVNIKALYAITKLGIKNMKKGKILNVASIAGILPAGPYMAQYYATKSYVKSLSLGIQYELKKNKANVSVHTLCPGPIKTNFDKNANVSFSLKGMDKEKCVKYTLKKLFKNKTLIIPGFKIRLAAIFQKLIPTKLAIKMTSKQQTKKIY